MSNRRTSRPRVRRDSSSRPHRRRWQLQDAKARFSEVFRLARSEGPQRITRHGKEEVVVLPAEQFDRLTRGSEPRSLVQFFAQSPLARFRVRLDRQPDYGRPVDL